MRILSQWEDAQSVASISTMRNKGQQAKDDSVMYNFNISPRVQADCTLDDILALKGDKKDLGQAQVSDDEQKELNESYDNSTDMHLKEFINVKSKKKKEKKAKPC